MADWYRPTTLAEALEIRGEQSVTPLAGGTDLYVRHRRGNGLPPAIEKPLLLVAHLEELREISFSDDELSIGAAVPYTTILNDARTPALLASSIRELAAPALRNAGTLGGNICNASPAADAVCPLYTLDAACEVRSARAKRLVPVADLITGPGQTSLAQDELLVSIRIPRPSRPDGEEMPFYRKVGTRRANALSKLSIAATASLSPDNKISHAAIALGAVAPTVLRSREIEARIARTVSELDDVRDSVLDAYRDLVSPIDDQRSTAEYRRDVAVNLVRQFLDLLSAGRRS